MPQPATAHSSINSAVPADDQVNLSSIAASMNVPVALATFVDENGVKTFATHGLDLMHNLARFTSACNDLCVDRAIVIPDTTAHQSLGAIAKHWPDDDVRFLVGIPLYDKIGHRVGSLAVMNTSKAVAGNGISFRTLIALGKAFARTGRLHSAAMAA
jgi:hypothetical protein